jgi:hypothetical protein
MSTQTVETIRGQVVVVQSIDDHPIAISGRLPRIARVRDEPFACVTAPESFIEKLKAGSVAADIFTFSQELADTAPKYPFHLEWDSHAVVPVTTYDHWWKKQINDKSRNMVRKASKNGVEIRTVEFDDALVASIKTIYDETPVRQGKAFWHYKKDLETLKREHSTFLDRSQFVGAFFQGEMIGFIKLVYGRNVASLMQIISMIGHRDKAPTNALVAKAVEICAAAGIPYLHYGVWSTGGLGAFKMNHAFVRHEVPRYYVPLNARGRLLLRANLHHRWREFLPKEWIERLAPLRERWNSLRYRAKK